MGKFAPFDKSKMVYAEVGNKVNYAACLKQDNGSLKFMGWISKSVIKKESDTIVKSTKEEIGL